MIILAVPLCEIISEPREINDEINIRPRNENANPIFNNLFICSLVELQIFWGDLSNNEISSCLLPTSTEQQSFTDGSSLYYTNSDFSYIRLQTEVSKFRFIVTCFRMFSLFMFCTISSQMSGYFRRFHECSNSTVNNWKIYLEY